VGGVRSVADQEEEGREFIDDELSCCYVVGAVLRDHAISAWNPKKERPSFNEAMARLAERKSDGLWVWDLTRFSRKMLEGEQLLQMAAADLEIFSGVRAWDLRDPDQRANFREAFVAAARESDKTSQRTTRGKKKKAMKRGKSNASRRGFARPGLMPKPEGWEPGDPRAAVADEVVAAEREALRVVARAVLAGKSLGSQCAWLNAEGFTTTEGKPWGATALKKTLMRPAVAGLVEYLGEVVPDKTLPGEHALAVEEWEQVCAFLGARSRGAYPKVYVASGLMRCSRCRAPLGARPLQGIQKGFYEGTDIPKAQYWCVARAGRPGGCRGMHIDRMYADRMIEAAVIARLSDRRHAEALTMAAAHTNERRAELAAEIRAAKELGQRQSARLGADLIDEEQYDRFLSTHVPRLRAKQEEFDALDDARGPVVAPDEAAAVWDASDLDMRRRMVRDAFPKLTLLPADAYGRKALRPHRFDWHGVSLDGFTAMG
jgi:DNA invertase Pin-like site-specific DNA recombinase